MGVFYTIFCFRGFLQVEILLSNIVLCAILAIMKLSQWAKEQGLTYRGAWRMWKAGQLPVPAEQLPTGTIIVKAARSPTNAVGLYARVSSSDQKKDWEAQLGRLVGYAQNHRWVVVQAVAEVGSGLNGHRHRLIQLLADPQVEGIVVEHRDRLMRFGAEYVEAALRATGRKLMVVEADEVKDDLVQGFGCLTILLIPRHARLMRHLVNQQSIPPFQSQFRINRSLALLESRNEKTNVAGRALGNAAASRNGGNDKVGFRSGCK